MSSPDIDAIVKGLTKAQREAILRAESDGWIGKRFVRWWQADGPVLRSLIRLGLGFEVWSGIALTERGMTVRAAITGDSHA